MPKPRRVIDPIESDSGIEANRNKFCAARLLKNDAAEGGIVDWVGLIHAVKFRMLRDR